MTHEIIEITADDDGQRLDRWLKKKRPDLPYALVQKLLRKGQVRVDGGRAKPETRLVAGQKVRMPLGEAEEGAEKFRAPVYDSEWLRQYIVFIDDDLIVINKPSGLAVQGGSGLRVHLEMLLDDFVVRGVPPRLVHRLDRETSGLLVMARSAQIARRMGEVFSERDVEKTYVALVSPAPQKPEGHIDLPLEKIAAGKGIEKMQVDEAGRPAQTDYRIIAQHEAAKIAAVLFWPRTGRTHQIRVHAAAMGFPLLGDEKYDGDMDQLKKMGQKPRVQLHAARLVFAHPRTGKAMDFQAPVPDDMAAVFTACGFSVNLPL